MEGVERVVGEGLHVLQVGGVAGGAGGFEGGEDVVARVVEDPFSAWEEEEGVSCGLFLWFSFLECVRWDIPDPEHAGPSLFGLSQSKLQALAFVRAVDEVVAAADGA